MGYNWRYRSFHGDWMERGASWFAVLVYGPMSIFVIAHTALGHIPVWLGTGIVVVFSYPIILGVHWLVTNRKR